MRRSGARQVNNVGSIFPGKIESHRILELLRPGVATGDIQLSNIRLSNIRLSIARRLVEWRGHELGLGVGQGCDLGC
jgi:hypothetical protein